MTLLLPMFTHPSWPLSLLLALFTASAFASPVISEFMASNDSTLTDDDGDFSDWIEITNTAATNISLEGYHLTDDSSDPQKWTFPALSLNPGASLIVFASNKNRITPSLHTNFKLSASGEYLALIHPDGSSIATQFSPTYPPQFPDGSFGGTPPIYFNSPTPGTPNTSGQAPGPLFGEVTENPPQPSGGPLTITAEISSSISPVTSVTAFYRLGFSTESQITLLDDGNAPDSTANDGLYSGTLPASSLQAGEMTRWRFVATDSAGTQTKEPAFRDPTDSHQYFGTVQADPAIESKLNVLHWFIQIPSAANNTTGTTGSVYYRGEFYDNVHFNRHGQSSAFFVKKSYNLDFNKTQHFQWSEDAPRVADIDLLTNWADKSKVRHPLAWEVMRESGVDAHFAFTVRVEQNGNFFSTADFVEDGDDIYLDRAGLNKDGALYKVNNNVLNKDAGNTANSGFEKKNRRSENNDDLQALIDGLDLNGTALTNYIRDNIDIPKTVNLLAANSVIRNVDMQFKNWYIYRDTGETNEWAILPWDLDLSQGRIWNFQNTYFDNATYVSDFVISGDTIRLVSQLFNNPDTRAMIMRRIRTLSDEFLQPDSTPLSERWYERRLDEQSALIDDPFATKSDAQLDFEKWGSWTQGNGNPIAFNNSHPDVESMAEAIDRWKTEYLPGRRNEIYNRQTVGNGGEIPDPQGGQSSVTFTPLVQAGDTASYLVPSNNNLGTTWRGSPANEPFDTSSWNSGPTGLGYERGSGYESLFQTDVGTEMSSNNSIYIRIPFNVTDPSAFEQLELRMQWDDGFVAFLNGTLLTSANAPATLSYNSSTAMYGPEASPSHIDIYNVSSALSSLVAGQNILAIHGLNESTGSSDFLIRPQLHAGFTVNASGQPALQFGAIEFSPDSGIQDEEFIEITNPFNFAVDASNWQITGGISHTFAPGTVIPAGQSLYLSPDVTTFRARSASPTGNEGHFIQGAYNGHLSSFGETLNLLDADAQLLTTTTFAGDPSDAQLYLVVSEIMYHPEGDGLAEFIELTNISPSLTLDLDRVRFVSGIEFDFTGSTITSLAPGERVLIVRDVTAFTAVHGTGLPIAGTFTNESRLNNGGETLKLEDALNGTVQEFTYNNIAPWPLAADAGYSLVLIDPNSNPDHNDPTNWRSSTLIGGNPATSDGITPPLEPDADLDGNGIPDLIDYALGNNLGNAPIPITITLENEGTPQESLNLTYPLSLGAEAISISIEESSNLSNWQDATANIIPISETNLNDGRALRTLSFAAPLAQGERHFFRLKVSQNSQP